MFLINTADQRFWKKDEKILFLGEWCKIYNQRHIWSNLDHEVLPYHWDDRGRLYRDYQYLNGVYEKYLKLLAERLNDLHGGGYSARYWRIIIGPWLFYFIEILYDRYLSIQTAIRSGLVTGTWIIPRKLEKWASKDFPVVRRWGVSDEYNQYLYSRIIETLKEMPFNLVNFEITPPLGKESNSYFKNAAKRLFGIYSKNLPSRWNQVVLVASYLNFWDLIRLHSPWDKCLIRLCPQLCLKMFP